MIGNGEVIISLDRPNHNEYFKLYRSNYFGDIPLLLRLKAMECYKSTAEGHTLCYCLNARALDDLMVSFPDVCEIFSQRAIERRVEFQRIKVLYCKYNNVDLDPLIDDENLEEEKRKPGTVFNYTYYSDKLQEDEELPPYLVNKSFYFGTAMFKISTDAK